jgi:hypothetical protein
MGRIVVTEFVSVDGVFEDPGGSESFEYGGSAASRTRASPQRGRRGKASSPTSSTQTGRSSSRRP